MTTPPDDQDHLRHPLAAAASSNRQVKGARHEDLDSLVQEAVTGRL
ncbi:hypothetical protein [Streptomyces werraensis]